jgi:hypothetical protein
VISSGPDDSGTKGGDPKDHIAQEKNFSDALGRISGEPARSVVVNFSLRFFRCGDRRVVARADIGLSLPRLINSAHDADAGKIPSESDVRILIFGSC